MTLRAAIKQKDEHKAINYLDPIASMNLSPFKAGIDLHHERRQSVTLSQSHTCMQAVITWGIQFSRETEKHLLLDTCGGFGDFVKFI